MKVPILLPNIFDYPFTYESELNLKVGDEIKWSEINNKSLINSFGMNSKRLPCLNN